MDDLNSCECEVSNQAMNLYLTYPMYKGWKKIKPLKKTGCLLESPEEIQLAKPEENQLDKPKLTLSADVLTSIREPVKTILESKKIDKNVIASLSARNCKGWEIKETLLCKNNIINVKDIFVKEIPLLSSMQQFAYVYYWCGNMMPVISTWSPGSGVLDTWKIKIDFILEQLNTKSTQCSYTYLTEMFNGMRNRTGKKEIWEEWILFYKNEIKKPRDNVDKFIRDNYLQDMVEFKEEKNIYETIDMNPFPTKNEDDKDNAEWHESLIKWFNLNTDLIIKRSYRIAFGITGEFDETDLKNIERIKEFVESKFKIDSNNPSHQGV